MNKKWTVAIWIGVIIITVGCSLITGKNKTNSTDHLENPYTPDLNAVESEGLSFGENANWPAYLPDDLPVLDGAISMVFDPVDSVNSKTRIFYNQLSNDQINEFLDRCEQAGYQIKYLVYVANGDTESSDKRLKAGKFDAVDITKDNYRMRLEAGNGEGTLDIFIKQISNNSIVPTKVVLDWPADLYGIVPQPEFCQIANIANLAYGGYQIRCEYNDGDIRLDQFLSELSSFGYAEENREFNDQNEVITIWLSTIEWQIEIHPQGFSNAITFMIRPVESK